MDRISLPELIAARIVAKHAEDKAAAARREIDAQIAAALADPSKPEGSISQRAGDYKVTVTYGVTRKADTESLQRDWEHLPPHIRSGFRWKADVTTAEIKKLEGVDLAVAAKYITTSPSSPSIKIEA